MPIIRSASNNSHPCQTVSSILYLVAASIFCWGMGHATAAAQISNLQAKVRRVTPGVTYYRGSLTPSTLKQGEILQPGDVIDTGRSGRVVIDLDDGSQVTIFPGSRVELKNFAGVGTWRDLLDVTVGRVRATINHGKRPNPYRVFSPIASIAVRGTDFLVIVEPSGETRVVVYEGLVEVSSLLKPQQSVLIRPGRNIIVRPDGDISLVTAAPRGELNEIRNLRVGTYSWYNDVHTAYTSHRENYTNLRPSRFTAFNDSHLDSLQNPAYATEFRQSGGRLYLVPSFSPEVERSYDYAGPNPPIQPKSVNLFNYTLSPQLSYFAPLGSRMVVGGGAAVTKTDLGVAEAEVFYGD
ncbi:MAG: FecR family protein [Blastocatellia bacterium]